MDTELLNICAPVYQPFRLAVKRPESVKANLSVMGKLSFLDKNSRNISRTIVFCAYLFQYTCCFAQTWETINFYLHSRTTGKLHFGTCINIFLSFLNGVWHEILDFFHESVCHWPLSILLGLFKICKKICGDICNLVCLLLVSNDTTAIYYRWQRWLSLVQNFHWFDDTSN